MRPWRRRAILLRDLRAEDAPALARLHGLAFHRGWGEDEFEQLLAASSSLGEAASFSRGGGLQGFVLSRIAGVEAEILSIVVDPPARRQGVARSLLSRHLDRLRERGVREVFLEVDEGNQPALAFYETFGLKTVGRRRGYYPRSSGGRGGALVLRCDLDG
ncbi:ribosomal-protein-alanine N-acetyltransferase [Rhizobiales bacterium GAS191]|jgi:ribosomal-protein-alanine N-acetyltransferase|nr:ribosomal-protein-alanine N-acetyltransferase [Rhizobiales bacterium GAS113]SEE09124.1 ribosomal-protein-alanine N-acetyltransferase [Rhizobiales bacterium GAS191]SEE45059.1 ribosomal-protein-alanine N-acetyltransferase [Rhizobiales bacterium GAS188]